MRSSYRFAVGAVLVAAVLIPPLCAAPITQTNADEPARITVKEPSTPFSGDYQNTPIRDVIMDIARAAKLNAVVPSDLPGSITAHFENLPASQALAFVTGQADADYTITGNTISVTRRAVVIRPSPSVRNPSMAERDVERIARQIDLEDGAPYRAPRQRVTEPIRVETYVSIQNSTPSYPAPVSGGFGPLYHDGGFSYITPPYITRFGPNAGARAYGQPYGMPTDFPFRIYR